MSELTKSLRDGVDHPNRGELMEESADRIEALETEIERRDAFSGCDGCSTGDCPHDSLSECVDAQAGSFAEQEARLDKFRDALVSARGVIRCRLTDQVSPCSTRREGQCGACYVRSHINDLLNGDSL